MSLRFVEEAKKEHEATLNLLNESDVERPDLIQYAKALERVIFHLEPRGASL